MADPQLLNVLQLRESLAKKVEAEKLKAAKKTRGSKRRKVIDIPDEEEEEKEKEKEEEEKEKEEEEFEKIEVTKPKPKPKLTEKAASFNLNQNKVREEPPPPRPQRASKRRKPPTKVRYTTRSESGGSEGDYSEISSRKLPRESPVRKSPRIRSKAIVLDESEQGNSDSEPELLLIPVPKKRAPLKSKENSSSSSNKILNKNTKPRSTASKPKPRPVSIDTSDSEPASTTPPPNKRSRKAPLPEPILVREVIKIPDKVVKRKVKVTSRVIKIKKPAGGKKNQGPAKAGATPPLPVTTVVANTVQKTKYTLDKVLGSGGFGYIYNVTDNVNDRKAVMKIEPQDNGPLFSEMHFYQRAGKSDVIASWAKANKLKYVGIPEMYGFGIHLHRNSKFRYLVMPLFDGDLLKKHQEFNKKFSIQTTLVLSLRMLEALHYMHEAGYVHADIKSANILIKNNQVYLADFGLARKYSVEGTHKPYKEEPAKAHDGTKEFTSIDAHKGVPPSRRGDLQILGYCAIEWVGGALPWFSWDNCNNIRSEKIKYEKNVVGLVETSLKLKTLNSKQWKALKSYLSASFSLTYDQTPDYTKLYQTFKGALSSGEAKETITWS